MKNEGKISKDAFEQLLIHYDIPHEQLKEMTKDIDKNNDQVIQKQEFVDFMLDFFKKILFE